MIPTSDAWTRRSPIPPIHALFFPHVAQFLSVPTLPQQPPSFSKSPPQKPTTYLPTYPPTYLVQPRFLSTRIIRIRVEKDTEERGRRRMKNEEEKTPISDSKTSSIPFGTKKSISSQKLFQRIELSQTDGMREGCTPRYGKTPR